MKSWIECIHNNGDGYVCTTGCSKSGSDAPSTQDLSDFSPSPTTLSTASSASNNTSSPTLIEGMTTSSSPTTSSSSDNSEASSQLPTSSPIKAPSSQIQQPSRPVSPSWISIQPPSSEQPPSTPSASGSVTDDSSTMSPTVSDVPTSGAENELYPTGGNSNNNASLSPIIGIRTSSPSSNSSSDLLNDNSTSINNGTSSTSSSPSFAGSTKLPTYAPTVMPLSPSSSIATKSSELRMSNNDDLYDRKCDEQREVSGEEYEVSFEYGIEVSSSTSFDIIVDELQSLILDYVTVSMLRCSPNEVKGSVERIRYPSSGQGRITTISKSHFGHALSIARVSLICPDSNYLKN